MEQCSETSACKIQTPGNYPEESTQLSEHGESLKSRRKIFHSAVRILPPILRTALQTKALKIFYAGLPRLMGKGTYMSSPTPDFFFASHINTYCTKF